MRLRDNERAPAETPRSERICRKPAGRPGARWYPQNPPMIETWVRTSVQPRDLGFFPQAMPNSGEQVGREYTKVGWRGRGTAESSREKKKKASQKEVQVPRHEEKKNSRVDLPLV